MQQQTLLNSLKISGIGLHSGNKISMTLNPAPAGTGIRFVRTDLGGIEIPATAEHVVNTQLATTIGLSAKVTVSTIEHLMSALYALEVDNVLIEIDGPEVPVLDGSAIPYVLLINESGVVSQRAKRQEIIITKPIEIVEGDRSIAIYPHTHYEIDFSIDFQHRMLRAQRKSIPINREEFTQHVSRARTFGFKKDVDTLRSMGLARGGSLENAVVIDEFKVLNTGGLRYEDEFVRHKILDCVGDLALCGARIRGRVAAVKSGHDLNNRLCRALVSQYCVKSNHLAMAAIIGQ